MNGLASLAAPAALSACVCTCVCVWPAGTGTADPPLTPGGVHRAVAEDERRWGGNGIYHLDKKRGAHHLQEPH